MLTTDIFTIKQFFIDNNWSLSTFHRYVTIFNLYSVKHIIPRLRRLKNMRNKSVTKYRCFLLYGKDEGLNRWNSYVNKQRITNTFEYKNKKYNITKDEFDSYNKSRAVTKNNLIKKHGLEEGIKKWEEYVERQRYTKSKKRYIDELGLEEGIKKFNEINAKKAITLKNFISRYGKDGYFQYNKIVNRRKTFYSNISQKLFVNIEQNLIKYLSEFNYNIYYATKNKEFGIFYKDRYFYYDFVIPKLKICVEFNGDHFHGNPKLFGEDDSPNPFDRNIKCKDIWELDKIKNNALIEKGFDLYVVWEKDYKQFPKQIEAYITKVIIDEFYKTI